ncbi:MAG: hypothetical protein WC829_02125 [Hyphomicrobium sp.]
MDLLGDPIPDGFGRRGRPAHVPTDEKRRLVIQLLAFDWSPERISAALAITPPTLRKHYFRQLAVRVEARARVEGRLLGALMAEAEAGNITAIDKYLKRFDRHDLAFAPPKRDKETKLGKKDAAKRDAKAPPDSTWGELVRH